MKKIVIRPIRTKRKEILIKILDGDEVILDNVYKDFDIGFFNKFNSIYSFISFLFKKYPELEDIYANTVIEYIMSTEEQNHEKAATAMREYITRLKSVIPQLFDKLNFQDSIKYDEPDAKRKFSNLVYFSKEDIRILYQDSVYARFFQILNMIADLRLPSQLQKDLFDYIYEDSKNYNVLKKIDAIIRSKILSDIERHVLSNIWKYIEINRGIEPYIFGTKLFNYIIKTLLPTLKLEDDSLGQRNFLGFFNVVIKNQLSYLMRDKDRFNFINADEIRLSSYNLRESSVAEFPILVGLQQTLLSSLFFTEVKKAYILRKLKYNLRLDSPIIKYINWLLTKKVFNVPSVNTIPDLVKMMSLFWYNKLPEMDNDYEEIRKFLASYSVPLSEYDKIDMKFFDSISYRINSIVNKVYKTYKVNSIYTDASEKALFRKIAKEFIKYKYINIYKGYVVEINWKKFINEYISLIAKLSLGHYDEFFDKVKNDLIINSSM